MQGKQVVSTVSYRTDPSQICLRAAYHTHILESEAEAHWSNGDEVPNVWEPEPVFIGWELIICLALLCFAGSVLQLACIDIDLLAYLWLAL